MCKRAAYVSAPSRLLVSGICTVQQARATHFQRSCTDSEDLKSMDSAHSELESITTRSLNRSMVMPKIALSLAGSLSQGPAYARYGACPVHVNFRRVLFSAPTVNFDFLFS